MYLSPHAADTTYYYISTIKRNDRDHLNNMAMLLNTKGNNTTLYPGSFYISFTSLVETIIVSAVRSMFGYVLI